MRILITGNMGYVGPVVARHLRATYPESFLAGADTGYFANCLTQQAGFPETVLDVQHFQDVRCLPNSYLSGFDAVIHLAAISNDPMGKEFEVVTLAVNSKATLDIARKAKAAGVRSFVFASSCSVYGTVGDGPRHEGSQVAPLTAYARSKIAAENGLTKLADERFTVSSLRFATACGMSPRLRLDLVLNDFVASAVGSRRIRMSSDGTPWRPLIHVRDMARAIDWALSRNGSPYLVVNVGSDTGNYQIGDLADLVSKLIPGVKIQRATDSVSDDRSYRVDFSLYRRLAPSHQPMHDPETTVRQLEIALRSVKLFNSDFQHSSLNRLHVLQTLRRNGDLTEDLHWNHFHHAAHERRPVCPIE